MAELQSAHTSLAPEIDTLDPVMQRAVDIQIFKHTTTVNPSADAGRLLRHVLP